MVVKEGRIMYPFLKHPILIDMKKVVLFILLLAPLFGCSSTDSGGNDSPAFEDAVWLNSYGISSSSDDNSSFSKSHHIAIGPSGEIVLLIKAGNDIGYFTDTSGSPFSVNANKTTNAILLKYNADGSLAWNRVIGQNSTVMGLWSLEVTDSGDILIAGKAGNQLSIDFNPNGVSLPSRAFILKFDSSGNLLNSYDKSSVFTATRTSSDGSVFALGWVLQGSGHYYPTLMKLSSTLDLVWETTSETPLNFERRAALAINSNSIILAGSFEDSARFVSNSGAELKIGVEKTPFAREQGYVSKWTTDGEIEWAKPITSSLVAIKGAEITSTGDILVGGEITRALGSSTGRYVNLQPSGDTEYTLTGNSDFTSFVAKYSANGDVVWGKSFPSGITFNPSNFVLHSDRFWVPIESTGNVNSILNGTEELLTQETGSLALGFSINDGNVQVQNIAGINDDVNEISFSHPELFAITAQNEMVTAVGQILNRFSVFSPSDGWRVPSLQPDKTIDITVHEEITDGRTRLFYVFKELIR